EADPRVPLADLPGQTGEDRIAARAAEADAHPAGQPLLSSTGDAPGAVDLSADRRRGFEQRFPGRRQSDPTGRPFEQIDVEVGLEGADHLTEGGLGDAQPLRRPTEMQLLGTARKAVTCLNSMLLLGVAD